MASLLTDERRLFRHKRLRKDVPLRLQRIHKNGAITATNNAVSDDKHQYHSNSSKY
jgi:hypothetical protein